jgi:hypothetical protein
MSAGVLRCAVLVPVCTAGPDDGMSQQWSVLWANGDEAEARKIAAAWAADHPGYEAHIFIRDDTARAVTKIEWTKP